MAASLATLRRIAIVTLSATIAAGAFGIGKLQLNSHYTAYFDSDDPLLLAHQEISSLYSRQDAIFVVLQSRNSFLDDQNYHLLEQLTALRGFGPWTAHYIAIPILNVTAMRKAARCLVGKHDFKSFQSSGCTAKSTLRAIYRLSIAKEDDFIRITVDGSGFLKYMVRIIVGTLIEIGWGKWSSERMLTVLKSKDRLMAGPTAPSRGLCLVKVVYGKRAAGKKSKGTKGRLARRAFRV